jgi:hypothetical protein
MSWLRLPALHEPDIMLGVLVQAFGRHTITGARGCTREFEVVLVALHRPARVIGLHQPRFGPRTALGDPLGCLASQSATGPSRCRFASTAHSFTDPSAGKIVTIDEAPAELCLTGVFVVARPLCVESFAHIIGAACRPIEYLTPRMDWLYPASTLNASVYAFRWSKALGYLQSDARAELVTPPSTTLPNAS